MNRRILAGLAACVLFLSLPGCSGGSGADKETTAAVTLAAETTVSAAESDAPAGSTASSAATEAAATTAPTSTAPEAASDPDAPAPDVAIQIVYPGVLRLAAMSRDDVAALLGGTPDVYQNRVQGIDVVKFADRGILIEYDANHGNVRAIQLSDRTFVTSSGSYARFDVDGDGVREAVSAYEDTDGNGHVAVFREADGTLLTDTVTQSFGGGSALSFTAVNASGEERLIVLDSRASWDCDVFSFSNGQLISVMPAAGMGLDAPAGVEFSDGFDAVDIQSEAHGLHFSCPLPSRLSDILTASPARPTTRFAVSRKPVVADEGLMVRVRTSLEIKMADLTGLESAATGVLHAGTEGGAAVAGIDDSGRFCDVGAIDQEYRYMGGGQWKLLSTSGSAKYDGTEAVDPISRDDLAIDGTWLATPLYDFMDQFDLDESDYADIDLDSGVTLNANGLLVDVRSASIAGLTLEPGCAMETARGLKTGDARERALALYGLPDKGYYEDDVWIWWYFRDWEGTTDAMLPDDAFWIEFSGSEVRHAGMTATIPQ